MGLFTQIAVIASILMLVLCGCSVQKPRDISAEHALPVIPEASIEKNTQAKLARILYQIGQNDIKQAVSLICDEKKHNPHLLHTDLLQTLGLAILKQGMQANDIQVLTTSLYGIRIAQDERLTALLEHALKAQDPQIQLIALHVLASFETEYADTLLEEAMRSNFIFVRLEAAFILAQKQRPMAYEQIEALMHKLDPEFRPLFPKLFAIEQSQNAQEMLKRLLFDEDVLVRSEAILACSDFHRDDLLDEIRMLAKDPNALQQEACAYALGSFKDHASKPLLQKIAASQSSASLAAFWALYQLGDLDAKEALVSYANAKNLFAIRLLAHIPDTNALLLKYLADDDVSSRVNAALALLEKKDPACLDGLMTIVLDTPSDFTFQPAYSVGKTLLACKVVPSSSAQYKNQPLFFEMSLRFRESVLLQAAELPERDFLTISETILQAPQKDLIPCCINILQNMQTTDAIHLLKKNVTRYGAPLTRAWCALALFRLHVEGPYLDAVTAILKSEDDAIFQSRPPLPWRMRADSGPHDLTLQEKERLIIEAYQALAEAQTEETIELLLKAIRDKNVQNRYTLAGLLMRSAL